MLRILGLLFCATLLIAQVGPGRMAGPGMMGGPGQGVAGPKADGPRFAALKDYLGLSDDQVSQLQAVQTARREAVRTAAQQLRDKQQALRALIDAGNADPAAVGKTVLEIEAMRKQVKTIDDSFAAKATAVLTGAQTQKLADLQKALELGPAAHQAVGLQLIEPPTPPAGARANGVGMMGRAGQFGRFGFRR